MSSSLETLKSAFQKTRSFLSQKLSSLWQRPINEEWFEELEQALFEADLGMKTASEIAQKLRQKMILHKNLTSPEALQIMQSEVLQHLENLDHSVKTISPSSSPLVILIVGVNGNGKTTTIAKLAYHFKKEGKKVLIAAADTFRAAAVEQLEVWKDRLGVDIVLGKAQADPSAVVFDALNAARARHAEIVLIDTAGRLQTKTALMQELEKMRRTCHKVIPAAPHETLLVIDGTTGQNGIDQAKVFNQYTPLTGLVLTKMDGTAKGGIAIAIQRELACPVKFMGIGERMEDLIPFKSTDYVQALFD